MVFSSVIFMFMYLPVVLLVYYIAPWKWRNIWLFVVNMLFYGWGEPVYIILMVICITINYINGILIDKYRDDNRKARLILVINVVINIGMLVFFKYIDLII